MYIHTKTKKQFMILMKFLHKEGYEWNGGDSLMKKNNRHNWKYKSETYIHSVNNKKVFYGSLPFLDKKRLGEIKANKIKSFTEANLKKLLLINNLRSDDENE